MFVIGGRFYRASRPGDNLFRHLKLPSSASRLTRPVQANAIVHQAASGES
jgi:hypothetical protein